MFGQQKNRTLYHQNYSLIERPLITFQNPDTYQNYLGFFEKYKCSGITFLFSRAPDVFLMSSHA